MRANTRWLLGIGMMTLSAAIGRAADAPRDWDGILQRLASPDFALREAAQKEIEKVPRAEYATLKRLAGTTDDPEARARLDARIIALDGEIAFDPPPISIHVENATLDEVRAALRKATGAVIGPQGISLKAERDERFTLDAREMPFWDVIQALSLQHPLDIQAEGDVLLTRSQRSGVVRGTCNGGFFAWAAYARRSTILMLNDTQKGATEQEFALQYFVAADPRMSLIAVKQMRTISVTDDLGNELYKATPHPSATRFEEARGFGWAPRIPLVVPENHGTKIASLRGEGQFIIGTGELRAEVGDIASAGLGNVGPEQVTFENVAVQEGERGSLSFLMRQVRRPGAPRTFATMRPVSVRMVDAAGRELWQGGARYVQNVTLKDIPIKAPVKAILTVAAREKEITIQYEFKDLPLPF